MQPRSDGAPWWWAGPRAADRLGGASGNVKALVQIPFFDGPAGRRTAAKAGPGAVYPILDQQVLGENTWVKVRPGSARAQDPSPWIVAQSGPNQYAVPTADTPREPPASRFLANGWPVSPAPFAGGDCVKLADTSPVRLTWVEVPVRSGYKAVVQVAESTAQVFAELIRWFDDEIEPVKSVGGYCHREIRGREGTGKVSHHAAGTAIDINASKHPLGCRNTFTPDQQHRIRNKISELGLAWGGDWGDRPDDMHFEVKLDPAAFRALHERRGLKLEGPVQIEGPSAASKAWTSLRSLFTPGETATGQALVWKEYAGFGLKVGGAALALTLGGALVIKAVRARRRGQAPFTP
jgi:hypothetical protein